MAADTPDTDTDADATDTDAEAEPGPLLRVYDTVTPGYAPHPDAEMDAIGWMLFLGIVFLLLPFLPLLVLIWLISKVAEAVAPA